MTIQLLEGLQEDFKKVFRDYPTGVAVITGNSGNGPVGLTASSLASVSVEPPTVVFSLSHNSGSAAEILKAESFVIHVLAAKDLHYAKTFAKSGTPEFQQGYGWQTLDSGEPYLNDIETFLRCQPLTLAKAGASTVVVASVSEIQKSAGTGSPLLYHSRKFYALDHQTSID